MSNSFKMNFIPVLLGAIALVSGGLALNKSSESPEPPRSVGSWSENDFELPPFSGHIV